MTKTPFKCALVVNVRIYELFELFGDGMQYFHTNELCNIFFRYQILLDRLLFLSFTTKVC